MMRHPKSIAIELEAAREAEAKAEAELKRCKQVVYEKQCEHGEAFEYYHRIAMYRLMREIGSE